MVGGFRTIVVFTFLSLFSVGCSLYESSGRQAIEKNSGGIVGSSSILLRSQVWVHCQLSAREPGFLRSPLTVLATRYESEGLSVFTDSFRLYLYRRLDNESLHSHCSAIDLQGDFGRSLPAIVDAAYLELNKLESETRPMSGH